MKTLKTILVSIIAVLAVSACNTDIERYQLSANPKAPVMNQTSEINITDANADDDYTFNWQAADFGQPVEVNYAIYITYNGKTSELFPNLRGTSYLTKNGDLKVKLVNLGIPAGQKVACNFKVTATVGTGYKVIESGDVTINVYYE